LRSNQREQIVETGFECVCIREGNNAALRLLLTHKDIQINPQHPYGDAPICLATKKSNSDAVKLLVEQDNRLNINQPNKSDEETAVSVAVRNGNLHILHILLRHPNIDLNLRNRWDETALLIAVKRGDIDGVGILLQDPRPIFSLSSPAEVAKSCNNHAMEMLIRGEIERNKRSSRYRAISLR
jgi:ankyrin repeat protein